jgi:large subunit ribosomal protein L10
LRKEQKAQVIDEIAAQIQQAGAVYAVDYRGLSVTQAATLRTSLREVGASFRIVKNTLTLRAADKAGEEQLKPLVEEGPTALTFVEGDPALAAKALDAFVRQAQVMEFKGGVLEGRTLTVDEIRTLARLPSRDQLNAQIAGVIASPITGLVRGLGSLLSGLAIALGQVQVMKETALPAHETEGGGEAAQDMKETALPAHETEGGGEAAQDMKQESASPPAPEPEPEAEAPAPEAAEPEGEGSERPEQEPEEETEESDEAEKEAE